MLIVSFNFCLRIKSNKLPIISTKSIIMMKKLLFTLMLAPILSFGQFTQNFDGGTTIPAGWTVINGGDALNTWVIIDFATSTTLSAHSGTKAAGIAYAATAHADYLITPAVTVTAGVSDYLSFWGRSRDPLYPETISVRLSTTGVAAADFTTTLAATVAPPSGAAFHKYQYDLTPYVGQTVYIGFYSATTDKFYFDIDDVAVAALPTCWEPTVITSTTTVQSANVTWTSNNANFELQYGVAGFTFGSGTTIPTSQTNATIPSLDANTIYEYYVRSICTSSLSSAWVGPYSFKTKCAAVTSFPFSEGFESTTIPDCWSNLTVSGAANWTYVTANGNNTITPRTGTRMAEFRTVTQGDKTKLVLPQLNLTSVVNPQLDFYYANANWAGDIDQLRVFYKTTESGAWVQVGANYTTENTTWAHITLALPNPSATYYVAFEGTSRWARGLNLDDVTVSASLATGEFNAAAFKVFPNPVKDFLNISYVNTVSSVEVYNLLGQRVMSKNINANEAQIDLTSLQAGNYLAKVYFEDAVKTIKIIKE